ncbi:hypothetical protein [Haloplanus halobius]|uniref:hypothetical protein n=1 Tax=Haloplanus halobius TaxID=2934938 RepID=UPI00200CC73A|nr:hypothetical protein [Haloplanus sp. XH21]
MSETLEFAYTETNRRGDTKIRANADFPVDTGNPHVDRELGDFFERLSTNHRDPFYGVAYLISEYGDEIVEEVEEIGKEDLRDYVVGIEAARTSERERQSNDRLSELLEDADAAEEEKIIEAAEAAAEGDISDFPTHEAMVRGEE